MNYNIAERVLVPVDGGAVAVRVQGSGRPVLFVHGALVNSHLWDGVVGAAPGITAILPDLPLGAHEHPLAADAPVAFPDLARMVLAVLDHVREVHGHDRVTVVGNDTGGALVQHLLANHPDRFEAAFLTSCDAFDNFPPKAFWWFPIALRVPGSLWVTGRVVRTARGRRSRLTFGRLIRRPLPAAEAERLLGPLWRSPGARRDLRRAAKQLDRSLTLGAVPGLARFPRPVDVAWSEDDPIFPPEHADRLAATFPAGRVVEPIHDALGLSPLDQPEQVAARLRDLLARLP